MSTNEKDPIYIPATEELKRILSEENTAKLPSGEWKKFKDDQQRKYPNDTIVLSITGSEEKSGVDFNNINLSNFDFTKTSLSCSSFLNSNLSGAVFDEYSDLTNVIVSLKSETIEAVKRIREDKIYILEENGIFLNDEELKKLDYSKLNLPEDTIKSLETLDQEIKNLVKNDLESNQNYSQSFTSEFLRDNPNIDKYLYSREESLKLNGIDVLEAGKGLQFISTVQATKFSNTTSTENDSKTIDGTGFNAGLEIKNTFSSGASISLGAEFNKAAAGLQNASFSGLLGKEGEKVSFGIGPKLEFGQFVPEKEIDNYISRPAGTENDILVGPSGFVGLNLNDKTTLNLNGSATFGTDVDSYSSNKTFRVGIDTEVNPNLRLGIEAQINNYESNEVSSSTFFVGLAAKWTLPDGKGPKR